MELEKWRSEIDEIDLELAQLIEYRAALSKKIGVLKKKSGRVIDDEKREREILGRAAARGRHLSADAMQRIFRGIIEESRKVQE
jgi:chorismate mutase